MAKRGQKQYLQGMKGELSRSGKTILKGFGSFASGVALLVGPPIAATNKGISDLSKALLNMDGLNNDTIKKLKK